MADQATAAGTESWQISQQDEHLRVDAFLRKCLPYLSRRRIDSAIHDRLFLLNGRIAKKGDRVNAGDVLRFYGPPVWLAPQPSKNATLEVPVVYEDSALLIVNKPSGMPTHGFSGKDDNTLANFIAANYPALLKVGKSRWEPGILHRLDRETSGLILIAKTQKIFDALREQFRRREITKIYWALVCGNSEAIGSVDLPLAHDRSDRSRMRAIALPAEKKERTWQAATHYKKLAQSPNLSLLEVQMRTGVTHQIRAHLAAIGHPLVGDQIYGDREAETFGLQRLFLHARQLELYHPERKLRLVVEASLPADLRQALMRLRIKI